PEANAGGDVTNMLLDYELQLGQIQKAAERGRQVMARGHAHFGPLYKVAETLIESAQPNAALPLLRELRGAMIEAGEQDKFVKSLTTASERLPGNAEPLEMLVDFSRTTSDPFRLNAALGQLSDIYAAAGDFPRAEALLQELVERNKDDERVVARLNQLRERAGGSPVTAPEALPPETEEEKAENRIPQASVAVVSVVEEPLDEETQRYIAQALTDVDLFSSYGLTQKATHLLENVLQRAPRHTPTLERLLDLYLGAGNERRTAELAGQLEQIHRERNDQVNADRFAELRQRFQKAAGVSTEELQAAPPMAAPVMPEAQATAETAPETAVQADKTAEMSAADIAAEFGIPLTAAPLEPVVEEFAVAPVPIEEPATSVDASPAQPVAEKPVTAGEELDLSDEWEAISQDVVDTEKTALEAAPAAAETESEAAPAEAEIEVASQPEPEPDPIFVIEESEAEPVIEQVAVQPEPAELEAEAPIALEIEPEAVRASTDDFAVQPDSFEINESSVETAETPIIEIIEEPAAEALPSEPVAPANGEFELELTPEPSVVDSHAGPATTEDFLNELAAEVEELEAPASDRAFVPATEDIDEPAPIFAASSVPAAAISENGSSKTSSAPMPEITTESLNELAEVFQEFRSELGELGEEDEDLETHYNLGIAYREMGLLDEAIGEFQKVAKAVQKGKPFRYTMNCSTMLGLSFMDKGEPNIAALWYQRALEVPGLEHETILALRYDLGLALEAGGDSSAALDCFRQVYAANIEYRDVADRISTLQKR
ncbi:MAG: tetratricopeptide repeat protein, partial [Candidatus Acidiferrales bacterium]